MIYMVYSSGMSDRKRIGHAPWVLAALLGIPGVAMATDIVGRVAVDRQKPRAPWQDFGTSADMATELDTLAVRVFLRGPEMVTTRRSGPITIQRDIRDGLVRPAFEVIRLGDRVAITNRDPMPRRAFVFARDRTLVLGPMGPGVTSTFQVSHFGAVELFTDATGGVRSMLFVAENPFVVQVGPDGRFLMGGVPPGDYRLIAWRPGKYLGECFVQLSYPDSVVDAGTIERR